MFNLTEEQTFPHRQTDRSLPDSVSVTLARCCSFQVIYLALPHQRAAVSLSESPPDLPEESDCVFSPAGDDKRSVFTSLFWGAPKRWITVLVANDRFINSPEIALSDRALSSPTPRQTDARFGRHDTGRQTSPTLLPLRKLFSLPLTLFL
ncbi:hypothetical protein ElyMa_000294100 [Elysia marginata]|uniref:Uncharacterized protein n=1 Tax=Elysia marginata TaxID=1093978 RepID=A0AAV4F7P4_9GAST|nr:hypothetical protein ElyMa_000294100 [Elysia marginata]